MQFAIMLELSEKEIALIKREYPIKIGKQLKDIRIELGITQTKLAELTDKDRQYIYKIEKGLVTPNIATIKIIATALEISLCELFKE